MDAISSYNPILAALAVALHDFFATLSRKKSSQRNDFRGYAIIRLPSARGNGGN